MAGIETGANKYIHPSDANTRHVTDAEKAKWNAKAAVTLSTNLNGYAIIGGVILQWGYISLAGNSSKIIYFPTSFPNNCLNVQLTLANNTEGGYIAYVSSMTISSFTLFQYGKSGKSCYWFAIGY